MEGGNSLNSKFEFVICDGDAGDPGGGGNRDLQVSGIPMTPFSTPDLVPEPSVDPSNRRVRECSVTGTEAHPSSGDPGNNDGGSRGTQGRSELAARGPGDVVMGHCTDDTGNPGKVAAERVSTSQACLRGVCAIGCGCLRDREGNGKSKRTEEVSFYSQEPPCPSPTVAVPRGRFWDAEPTEADGDVPESRAAPGDGPKRRRVSSAALCGREGCAQVMRTNPYASDGVVDTASTTWPIGRGFESHRRYKVWNVLWLAPSPPSILVSYIRKVS